MLIQVLPNQVVEYWSTFKGDISANVPPIADWGPYDTNEFLYALMMGTMQMWLVADKEQKTKGIILTTVLNDLSLVRTLLIYVAVSLENTGIDTWAEGFDTLKKYAHMKGCSKIGAFVANEKVLALLSKHDVETRFVFAHINI